MTSKAKGDKQPPARVGVPSSMSKKNPRRLAASGILASNVGYRSVSPKPLAKTSACWITRSTAVSSASGG